MIQSVAFWKGSIDNEKQKKWFYRFLEVCFFYANRNFSWKTFGEWGMGNVIAPLLAIFMFGITFQTWKSLSAPHIWLGYCYKSIIKAIMGITIGCLCYKIDSLLKDIKFTGLAKCLWGVLEFGGFGLVIDYTYGHGHSKADWYLVLIMAVAITCAFAQMSILDDFFNRYRIFNWLGEFSFSLFLGHGYWCRKMKIIMPNASYYERIPVYLLIVFSTGLFIMYGSKFLKYFYQRIKEKYGRTIKSWFIAE